MVVLQLVTLSFFGFGDDSELVGFILGPSALIFSANASTLIASSEIVLEMDCSSFLSFFISPALLIFKVFIWNRPAF